MTGWPLVLLRSEGVVYPLTHTYVPPAALGVARVLARSGLAVALALAWFAHIGMDRALGLGLHYPDGSQRTHRGRLRRGRNAAGSGGVPWTA